jgi:transcriptional regulator with XRE-family HTH domain
MAGDKKEFGKQLAKYRKVTGLTQEEYAKHKGTASSYISKLERGEVNIQVDSMKEHASTFGVTYYQMGNPNYPVPSLKEMPIEIQRASEESRQAREGRVKEKAEQKSRGGVARLWSAKKIHELLGKGFFKEARTSKKVFLKLNPTITDKEEIKEYSAEIGKITASLSSGKFAVLLEKLPPLEGKASVRFVEKGK